MRRYIVPLAGSVALAALAFLLIYVIVATSPDTHGNLWTSVPEGYQRSAVVRVEAADATASTPLPAPTIAMPTRAISYSGDVQPILSGSCTLCHAGAFAPKAIDLSSYAAVMDTKAHAPLVVPGKPDESLLVKVLLSKRMPPSGPLSEESIGIIAAWVVQGATGDGATAPAPTVAPTASPTPKPAPTATPSIAGTTAEAPTPTPPPAASPTPKPASTATPSTAVSIATAPAPTPATPQASVSLAEGKRVFESSCGKCHPLPSASTVKKFPTDEEMTKRVSMMTQVAGLSRDEAAAVIEYLLSLRHGP